MLIQTLFKPDGHVASPLERRLEESGGGEVIGGAANGSAGRPSEVSMWRGTAEAAPLLSRSEDNRAAEEYRILRTRILQHPAKPRVILISSPGIGDGKTLTAVNLAATLSYKREGSVLLVDADLRRPRVNECLRIQGTPGLAQVLLGEVSAADAIVHFKEWPALHVLPSGGPADDPTELLGSAAARELFPRLRQKFGLILVDSPPIGPLADYEELSTLCDATLLVARPDTTSRALLRESLRKVGTRLLGVVLNGVEDWFLWTRYKPDYYRRYYRASRHDHGDPE
ncbi:MAG: CpsD/CapB family tyrosine-protein kinase [Acidobacteria bacterium]|nr:CpsD/CapB family tyrosine-protein kinase [Acidobacteriota bacterium]